MAGAKSLVLLCFLLVIASSQAASCKFSVCYRACRAVGGSKESCSKKCHCSLPTIFLPNELETKEAAVKEEMMMEEPSLNDKLMASCKFSVCYRACRAVGGSKESCSKKCHCSLPIVGLKEKMREALAAAEMEVEHSQAEAVLEEMTMEKLMSLNDNSAPKCKYQPCYRACRAVGGSKELCAKKCNCTQVTDVLA